MPFDTLFKSTHVRYSYDMISKYDTCSFLTLTPTLPHFILENVLVLIANSYESSYAKRTVEGLIALLIEIWDDFNDSTYLFLAVVFMSGDKVSRTLASELWIKVTTEGTMNHNLLGETLGRLEHNEYAPLKRLTDLIIANMLNISSLHNQGLLELLSTMIPKMNDEPIKGAKKLLEIYLEVLSLTKSSVPEGVSKKLQVWGIVKSLKSIINKIQKL